MIVAIDGPAGAGKSTVARVVAHQIGAGYLDTGALYRAVTLSVLRAGGAPHDADACADAARALDVALIPHESGLLVRLAGVDVTEDIRAPEVTDAVSAVSAHPGVRVAVTEASRRIMSRGDWVSDGRDVGTVIVPDAAVKVFLTAEPQERARRRVADLLHRGRPADHDAVLADIRRRDHLDSTRADSPLRRAEDAAVIDSTDLSPEQVVQTIVRLVDDARQEAPA